ncbi:MAG: type II toxin-antitoxin system VapC family toxin [Cytophagales bacterium]
MNGKQYLADTNAFIYLLQKRPAVMPLLNAEWAFSFITEIELLGKTRIQKNELEKLKQLLVVAKLASHTNEITRRAIELKQRYLIKTPDAIIAATAWQYDLPLITADVGFVKIKELNLFLIDIT